MILNGDIKRRNSKVVRGQVLHHCVLAYLLKFWYTTQVCVIGVHSVCLFMHWR